YESLSYCSIALRPRRRSRSTLFPYTSLFRSQTGAPWPRRAGQGPVAAPGRRLTHSGCCLHRPASTMPATDNVDEPCHDPHRVLRSEEHTSELQSRENLVCRLLLEKKKEKRK